MIFMGYNIIMFISVPAIEFQRLLWSYTHSIISIKGVVDKFKSLLRSFKFDILESIKGGLQMNSIVVHCFIEYFSYSALRTFFQINDLLLLLIYTGTGPPHTPTIPMIWSLCSIIIIITFCLSCSGCFVVKKDLASNQFPTNIVLPLLQSKKAAYKMYVCVCVSTLSSNRSHPFTPQYN